jgi:hypothetical protein
MSRRIQRDQASLNLLICFTVTVANSPIFRPRKAKRAEKKVERPNNSAAEILADFEPKMAQKFGLIWHISKDLK